MAEPGEPEAEAPSLRARLAGLSPAQRALFEALAAESGVLPARGGPEQGKRSAHEADAGSEVARGADPASTTAAGGPETRVGNTEAGTARGARTGSKAAATGATRGAESDGVVTARGAAHREARGVPRTARRPLSYAQERAWVGDVLGHRAHPIAAAFRVRGPLDLDSLTRARDLVDARHDSLRTVYGQQGGAPWQEVRPARPRALPLEPCPPAALEERLAAFRRSTIDLARGPVWSLRLLRLAPEEHALLLAVHPIVADGVALGILLRELGQAYAACRAGVAPWPPLSRQVPELAARERARALHDTDRAWWRGRLAPPLPGDGLARRTRTRRSGAMRRQAWALPADAAARLRGRACEAGVTPFVALLAGFAALLQRWSGQPELVVGTSIALRTERASEGLIGNFANDLVLRLDAAGDPRFEAWLTRVAAVCREAFAHSALPFQEVVKSAGGPRDPRRAPLFQTLFVVRDRPAAALSLEGLGLERLTLPPGPSPYELVVELVAPAAGPMHGELKYAEELFAAPTISALAEQLTKLLTEAAERPETRLSAFALAGPPPARPEAKEEARRSHSPPTPDDPRQGELLALWRRVLGRRNEDGGTDRSEGGAGSTPGRAETGPTHRPGGGAGFTRFTPARPAGRTGVRPPGSTPAHALDEDFFAAGGSSLQLAELLIRVEERFGVEVPVSDFYEDPTPGLLLRCLTGPARALPGCVVPLQPEGAGRPFFFLHAGDGFALLGLELARALGAERPVYGLRSPGLDGRTEPLASMPAIAAAYLEALRAVQPHGPLSFGGWCMGALLALEMACQLEERGDGPGTVAVISTDAYWKRIGGLRDQLELHRRELAGRGLAGAAGYVLERLSYRRHRLLCRLARRVRPLFAAAGRRPPPGLVRAAVAEQNFRASLSYTPRRFGGRLVYFQGDGDVLRDPRPFWEPLVGELTIVRVPGAHGGLLRAPHVTGLAEALGAELA